MSKDFEDELRSMIRLCEERRQAGLYTDVDHAVHETLIAVLELYMDYVSMEKKNGYH